MNNKSILIIKNQMGLMLRKRNFWIAFSIMMAYMIISYIYVVNANRGYDIASINSPSSYFIGNSINVFYDYFKLIFPFVVVLPFAFSNFEDKANQTDAFLLTRVSRKSYYIASVITSFLGSFFIILIPFILDIILNGITFTENEHTFLGVLGSQGFWLNLYGINEKATLLFPSIFVQHPILYNILFTFMLSCFSGLLGVFAYAGSLSFKKYKMLIFLPVYCLMYITSNMQLIGINFDMFDFVTITQNSSRNEMVFFLICVCMLLYSSIIIKKQISKDTLE